MQKKSAKIFALFAASIAWFGVLSQFYLIILNRVVSIPETIIRFFAYFTINTNILVALCFTFIGLGSKTRTGRFFSRPSTVTAITVYIIIVGIVYNTILRSLWQPQGLQMIVDEILHSVTPVLFILFWVIFTPTEELKWRHAFSWILYPLVYIFYALIVGAVTKFYPYLFVDVNRHGYTKALSNTGLVLFAIFLLSIILIATGKVVKNAPPKPGND
ncbi:MAG TPA: Pr6Pr family membrane protein [Chitinophagaceae bacterium]|jgi:hypothetical protein|nr:Pr6Pr family membrane protein [Chitinophagaceae bacterium]